ncbi:MAG: hypothetical protein WA532_00205 [Candidatus Korobacteraceae bacterium]
MLQQIESALHASLARVLTLIATFLPAVFALVLALGVGLLLGALLSYALHRVLTSLKLDERIHSSSPDGVLEWSSLRSPSLLLSRLVFWICVIAGAMIGIAAFAAAYNDTGRLTAIIFPYVARCVGAALIFVTGNLVARFLARTVLIGAVNMNLHYARLLSQGVKWMVLVMTLAMTLDHLSIGGVIVELAFGILFGGIVLTLALAVGKAFPELIRRSMEHHDSPYSGEARTGSVRHF